MGLLFLIVVLLRLRLQKNGIQVLLPVGVLEALKIMALMAAGHEIGFDLSLGYMACCQSQDVNWSL